MIEFTIDDIILHYKNSMEVYESLFSEDFLNTVPDYCRCRQVIKWLEELKEYKRGI